MSTRRQLADIVRRLDQVENALADAQARVPALRLEVRQIRRQLAELTASPQIPPEDVRGAA